MQNWTGSRRYIVVQGNLRLFYSGMPRRSADIVSWSMLTRQRPRIVIKWWIQIYGRRGTDGIDGLSRRVGAVWEKGPLPLKQGQLNSCAHLNAICIDTQIRSVTKMAFGILREIEMFDWAEPIHIFLPLLTHFTGELQRLPLFCTLISLDAQCFLPKCRKIAN